jgi:hypothetical protein
VNRVAVRILHPLSTGLGPLEQALLDARALNAERLARLFDDAGADDVEVLTEHHGGTFGAAVRNIARTLAGAGTPAGRGLVLLGSGSIPLATAADAGAFVSAAASGERRALANNRYSADVIAIGDPSALLHLPDLAGDNALPRWLDEIAGFEVDDLPGRWRLAVDLDSPLDVRLVGGKLPADVEGANVEGANVDGAAVEARLAAVRAVARDRRAELVVAGRTSATTLRWLERETAARVRALVEERGLRASGPEALRGGHSRPVPPQRPARSVLGIVLDDRGAGALGRVLAELGDAAIVDTRVLLAHRLGADERRWPAAEDRFASDLLLPDRVSDPWLRALTVAALEAPIPILLGGHSLVGPGMRLALDGRRRAWP